MTRRILMEEREQYEKEKNVVEMINVKAHDLKHQLQAIGQSIPEHEKAQIQQAVKQYDSTVRTGNRALDVVLTMKRMICESSDIEFSCMVNGKLLDFMEESDIYSLFGNLLDNAVEESRTFDEEHRIINLSVAQEKDFVLIHEENFIQVRPEMVDGLPQTTKPDTANHGFGIRSMQMIAEKYNGHLMVQIDRNVFQMDILLPIPRN
ncbi:MAG: sensor histidine kinase [Lachnospiraceae bacterium]|nr:sensor histidine kinase [Lachnospiraceae bacterium]